MNHILKTEPAWFDLVWRRLKTFEIRVDDRKPSFAIGDAVILVEWDREAERPRWIEGSISCIIRPPLPGIAEDFCVLGLSGQVYNTGFWSVSNRLAQIGPISVTPGKQEDH